MPPLVERRRQERRRARDRGEAEPAVPERRAPGGAGGQEEGEPDRRHDREDAAVEEQVGRTPECLAALVHVPGDVPVRADGAGQGPGHADRGRPRGELEHGGWRAQRRPPHGDDQRAAQHDAEDAGPHQVIDPGRRGVHPRRPEAHRAPEHGDVGLELAPHNEGDVGDEGAAPTFDADHPLPEPVRAVHRQASGVPARTIGEERHRDPAGEAVEHLGPHGEPRGRGAVGEADLDPHGGAGPAGHHRGQRDLAAQRVVVDDVGRVGDDGRGEGERDQQGADQRRRHAGRAAGARNRRSRSEFVTTDTLESAMAAPA